MSFVPSSMVRHDSQSASGVLLLAVPRKAHRMASMVSGASPPLRRQSAWVCARLCMDLAEGDQVAHSLLDA